jgi:hypothetical protein
MSFYNNKYDLDNDSINNIFFAREKRDI